MKFPFQSAKVQKNSHICKFSARKCQRDKKNRTNICSHAKIIVLLQIIYTYARFAALAHR